MDFAERLAVLAAKVKEQREQIVTEEAAKTALVLPFLSQVLGYDIFNPLEVMPEFTADVGMKKGEKVDYGIALDGKVQMLIECKRCNGPLSVEHASQLFRYFGVTTARIAILTNGERYQFYTDLDQPNKMDSQPFLVLDLLEVDETLLPELKKLTKESFDLDSILSAAESLKYVGQLRRAIAQELREPSPEWVKFLTAKVYEGAFTQRVRDQFTPMVVKAARQVISEQVNDRLKSALDRDGSSEDVPVEGTETPAPTEANSEKEITTTPEEIEAYQIIRAIVCNEVAPGRVTMRDQKNYCGILLDDNNRKPIARLHFNSKNFKRIGLLDEEKVETKIDISSLEDIYAYADELRAAVRRYLEL